MPYTKDRDRADYESTLGVIEDLGIATKGDLEFLICSLQDIYAAAREYRYSDLHDCSAATFHAGHEFERRFLDPREDDALAKNGEVFTRMKGRFDI